MSYMDSWTQYLDQLHQLVEKQTLKMKELEKRVDQLQNQMESNQKPSTNIEKIEYKFDQLKIETLEGTLNIGISPQDGVGIEDLGIEEQPFPPKMNTGQSVKEKIIQELEEYMYQQGPPLLQSMSRDYGQQFDESYQQFILNDIQKQLGDRVNHYLQQGNYENGMITEEQKQAIIQEVKNEIHSSLHQFLQNQSTQGDESP